MTVLLDGLYIFKLSILPFFFCVVFVLFSKYTMIVNKRFDKWCD